MKLFKLIVIAILLTPLFFSCGANKSKVDGTENKLLANTGNEFIELISNPNAKIIRSEADFDKLIGKRQVPFSKLDRQTIAAFKQGLVFRNNGLSTAKYDMIESALTPDEFIMFWEAFGLSKEFLQQTDYKDHECSSPGNCKEFLQNICTSNC